MNLKINYVGPDTKKYLDLVLKEHTARLPLKMYLALCAFGVHCETQGDLVAINIGSKSHFSIAERITQWLFYGKHYTFEPRHLEVVNISQDAQQRRPAIYDHKVHAKDPRFATMDRTHEAFTAEAQLYRCALDTEYDELRRHASENIRHRFPFYTAELLKLLDILGRTILANLPRTDPELTDFLRNNVQRFAQNMAERLDESTDLLCKVVDPVHQFRALLTTANEQHIQAGLLELRADLKKHIVLDTMTKVLADVTLLPVQPARPPPTGPSHANVIAANNINDLRADPATSGFIELMRSKRIIIATKNGVGTLRTRSDGSPVSPAERNNDFKFTRGELLVVQPNVHFKINSQYDHVVVNRHREIGEVYHKMGWLEAQQALDEGELHR